MKSIQHITLLLVFAISTSSLAQTITDTIYIDKDALLRKNAGISSWQETNYGSSGAAYASAWTNSSNAVTQRYIFDVDLSSLPQDILISEVKLYLFSNGNHYPLYRSNASKLYEIDGFSWLENTITWDNAPNESLYDNPVASLESTDAGGSNDANKDYVVDLTSSVSSNWDDQVTSTTFILRLDTEIYYTRMTFASSDNNTPANHPYFVVKYRPIKLYLKPKPDLEAAINYVFNGELNLLLDERYSAESSDTLNLEISDSTNTVIYKPTAIGISSGTNKLSLDLSGSGAGFVSGNYYTCTIRDLKGRKTFVRFHYRD